MGSYNKLFDLTDRVVVVAGGGGAIGSEMARACAAYGARVAIADVALDRANVIAAELGDQGCKAMGVALNVLDEDAVAACMAAVEAELGTVDVLINAVGTHIEQAAEDVTMKAWDTVLDINLRGAFLLSQAAARAMMAANKGGSIMHITSVRSTLGIRRGYTAYVASKGGLALLIKQMACEWAPKGIRVNGIGPTFTRTPLVADYMNDPDFYNGLVARIPMGRVCETSDLGGIALFLASDASAFITGQNILVDGGVTATQ